MNCRICGESASYRYCETCHKGSLPECDKKGHFVIPLCHECLTIHYEDTDQKQDQSE